MENQSSDTNAQMTALNPVLTLVISAALVATGGKQPFAASARSKEQREESGPSGHLPVFSVVQTRRMAAESPLYQMLPCSISQVQKIQLVALSPLRTLAMTHEAAVRPVIAALRS